MITIKGTCNEIKNFEDELLVDGFSILSVENCAINNTTTAVLVRDYEYDILTRLIEACYDNTQADEEVVEINNIQHIILDLTERKENMPPVDILKLSFTEEEWITVYDLCDQLKSNLNITIN